MLNQNIKYSIRRIKNLFSLVLKILLFEVLTALPKDLRHQGILTAIIPDFVKE